MSKFVITILLLTLSGFSAGDTGNVGNAAIKGNAGDEGDKDLGVGAWGMSFGLGVEKFRGNYIEKASINGTSKIVVVEKKYDEQTGGWLVMNWTGAQLLTNLSWGIYVGVKVTGQSSTGFDGFSLGPQLSFHITKSQPINVGIGWVAHSTRKLANGINEGETLPDHFDEIKYRETTENNYMLMVSRSF